MYQISGSSTIWSEEVHGHVKVFSDLYDVDNEFVFKPSKHPTIWKNIHPVAGYLTPVESQGYENVKTNGGVDEFVRFLSLAVLDEKGKMITQYSIPKNEWWFCSLEFAKINNWI